MKIAFISNDTNYFKDLKGSLKRSGVNIDASEIFYIKKNIDYQKNIEKIIKLNPNVVFLDYSFNEKIMLILTHHLRTILPDVKIQALFDIKQETNLYDKSLSAGANFCHIKNNEFRAIILSSTYDNTNNLKEVANAVVTENIKVYGECEINMKLDYFTKDYFHVEHTNRFQELNVKTNLSKNDLELKLLRSINNNYYYNYKYSSDLDLKNEEDKERVQDWIYRFKKKKDPSKRTRILFVSDEFNFLNNDKINLFEEDRFSIRFSRFLDKRTLEKFYSGIIIIDSKEVNNYINIIKNNNKKGNTPFIITFNQKIEADYDKLLVSDNEVDLDLILNIANRYQEKSGRKKTHPNGMGDQEERIYFSKFDKESDLWAELFLNMKEISEDYIVFKNDFPIEINTKIKINNPINAYITVVEENKAIIHGCNEIQRASIRKYINQLIDYIEKPKDQ